MDKKQKAVEALRLVTKPEQIRATLLDQLGTTGPSTRKLVQAVLTPEHVEIIYEEMLSKRADALVAHLSEEDLVTLIMCFSNPAFQRYLELDALFKAANAAALDKLGPQIDKWVMDYAADWIVKRKEEAQNRNGSAEQPADTG